MHKIDLIVRSFSNELIAETDVIGENPKSPNRVLLHKDIENMEITLNDIYLREKRFGKQYVKLGGIRDYDLPLRVLATIDFKNEAETFPTSIKLPSFRRGKMPQDIRNIFEMLYLVWTEREILKAYSDMLTSGKIRLRNNMKIEAVIKMIKIQLKRIESYFSEEVTDIFRYINSIISDKLDAIRKEKDSVKRSKMQKQLGEFDKQFDEEAIKKASDYIKGVIKTKVVSYLRGKTTGYLKAFKKGIDKLTKVVEKRPGEETKKQPGEITQKQKDFIKRMMIKRKTSRKIGSQVIKKIAEE